MGPNFKGRFYSTLIDNGLNQKNSLPKAILIHEILGISILLFTWTMCIFVKPSSLPILQGPINKVASMIPSGIKSSYNNNYIAEILSTNLGKSYVEASCLRKCIRPITIPAKIYGNSYLFNFNINLYNLFILY
jgi:hypothetical protein